MDVAAMRRVDRWLGTPICFLLTTLRRLTRRQFRGKAQPQRILFIKLAEQGTTVLAYWALRQAIGMVGRENVYFLVLSPNRFILDAMDLIPPGNVITIPVDHLFAAISGCVRAWRTIRGLRVDTAIDMEFFARGSAAMAYLSGARCRIGYHRHAREAAYRGDLMTHRLSFNPQLHTSQAMLTMVLALNVPVEQLPAVDLQLPPLADPLPRFQPRKGEVERFRQLLAREGVAVGSTLVLLNANCSDLLPLRRWPSDRYVELARRLLERHPQINVLFTGGPAEAAAADSLRRAVDSPRCVNFAGKTTLRDLMVLYGLSRVLVTNDSGPAHFAALTGIDVVVLFGPETPALFASRTPRTHVLTANLPCSPCVNAFNDRQSSCRDNLCMKNINVEAVFSAVSGILARQPDPSGAG